MADEITEEPIEPLMDDTDVDIEDATVKVIETPVYEFTIYYREKGALDEVMRFCKDRRMTIRRLRIHALPDVEAARYEANINISGNASPVQLLEAIRARPDIINATFRTSENR